MGLSSTLRNWFEKDRLPNLDAAKESPATLLTAGDFTVNTTTHKAYLRGEELNLSSAELDLLRYLLTHPKKLITPRTALVSSTGATSARSVEMMTTLLSLRRKLDAAAGTGRYLRTEPWILYSFSNAQNEL
jgi:DNA-binding response OmpR family regulator